MIQRKQTLFLLLAIIAYAVCLFLPIASVEPKTMGIDTLIYNLGLVSDGGIKVSNTLLPLFLDLVVRVALALVTIFKYKNRKAQMSLCSITMLFSLLWYIDYVLIYLGMIPVAEVEGAMEVKFAACLPFISIILVAMAKKGINDDEKLVKAADRIR